MSEATPLPQRRKFRVRKAFRRYERLVYMCGGTYTVLEDPRDLLTSYPKDMEFLVELLIEGTGTYKRIDDKYERFASHELDHMVKDRVLEELPLPKSPA